MMTKNINQPLEIRLLLFLLFIILSVLDLGLIQESECRSLTVHLHNIATSVVFDISEGNIAYVNYPWKLADCYKEIGNAKKWTGYWC